MVKVPTKLLEKVKKTQQETKRYAEQEGLEELRKSAEKSIGLVEGAGADINEQTKEDMTEEKNETVSNQDITQYGNLNIPEPSDTGQQDADELSTSAKGTGEAIENTTSLEDVKDIIKERYKTSGEEAESFGDMMKNALGSLKSIMLGGGQEEKLEEEREEEDITQRVKKVEDQRVKVANIKGEIADIEEDERQAKERAEQRLGSQSAIDAEKSRIERDYSRQLARKSARLQAESALFSAYQGNLSDAQSRVQDAVQAYTFDQQQKVSYLNAVISTGSTWYSSLKSEQQSYLQNLQQMEQSELTRQRQDTQYKLSLMTELANQGIEINKDDVMNMSKEELTTMYANKVAPTIQDEDVSAIEQAHREFEDGKRLGLIPETMTFKEYYAQSKGIEFESAGSNPSSISEIKSGFNNGEALAPEAISKLTERLSTYNWVEMDSTETEKRLQDQIDQLATQDVSEEKRQEAVNDIKTLYKSIYKAQGKNEQEFLNHWENNIIPTSSLSPESADRQLKEIEGRRKAINPVKYGIQLNSKEEVNQFRKALLENATSEKRKKQVRTILNEFGINKSADSASADFREFMDKYQSGTMYDVVPMGRKPMEEIAKAYYNTKDMDYGFLTGAGTTISLGWQRFKEGFNNLFGIE